MHADVYADVGHDITRSQLGERVAAEGRLVVAGVEDDDLQVVPQVQLQYQAPAAHPHSWVLP